MWCADDSGTGGISAATFTYDEALAASARDARETADNAAITTARIQPVVSFKGVIS
jgi:hypothetical protein